MRRGARQGGGVFGFGQTLPETAHFAPGVRLPELPQTFSPSVN